MSPVDYALTAAGMTFVCGASGVFIVAMIAEELWKEWRQRRRARRFKGGE